MSQRRGPDERPLYMISVAAELAGVHPQTLRIYERKHLITPKRSMGNTRLYSEADIQRLRLIQQLTQDEGVNLAGVVRILEMQCALEQMQMELQRMREQVMRAQRAVAAAQRTSSVQLVHIQRGHMVRRHG
jgi:MerR family transcriptional regulator/heat shock protein HspR